MPVFKYQSTQHCSVVKSPMAQQKHIITSPGRMFRIYNQGLKQMHYNYRDYWAQPKRMFKSPKVHYEHPLADEVVLIDKYGRMRVSEAQELADQLMEQVLGLVMEQVQRIEQDRMIDEKVQPSAVDELEIKVHDALDDQVKGGEGSLGAVAGLCVTKKMCKKSKPAKEKLIPTRMSSRIVNIPKRPRYRESSQLSQGQKIALGQIKTKMIMKKYQQLGRKQVKKQISKKRDPEQLIINTPRRRGSKIIPKK